MILEISIALATACVHFTDLSQKVCTPVLVGKNSTPSYSGRYIPVHSRTSLVGYGGDVLVLAQHEDGLYAVHRVWDGNKESGKFRRDRLKSQDPERRKITKGCINVPNHFFDTFASKITEIIIVK